MLSRTYPLFTPLLFGNVIGSPGGLSPVPYGRYYGKVYSTGWTGDTSLVVDSTVTDFTPHLDHVVPSVLVDSAEPEASAEIRFRITDADHDVELDSVEITNTSVSPPALAYGFPGHWQGWPQGRWGWFVAELPLAPGDNELVFCAHDAAGNVFGTVEEPCVTATVTRESPLVEARITAPDPSTSHSVAAATLVTLDGSTSIAPAGGVAVWAIGASIYTTLYPLQQTVPPVTDFELLRTTVAMPAEYSIKARLIVADSVDNLPADYWTTELPCERSQGEGRCDSAEVLLNRSCAVEPQITSVVLDQPAGGIAVGASEAFNLVAHVEDLVRSPYAYRWVVYDAADAQRAWPLATIGADDEGQGFSVGNDNLTVTAMGQGLPAGDYLLDVKARYPASGCTGSGWWTGRSMYPVALHVGHTFDGVAPGQVVEGAPFRVYSRSLDVGQPGYVEVDDDPHDATPGLVYSGLVQTGGYVEVAPGVGEVPASGSPWALRVSADSDFTASSPQLVDTFMVEPAGSVETPLLVTNEESVACGGADSECIHDLLPGQTWQGEWDRPGDVDWYAFSVGAGAEVSISLDRVDTSLPPLHPDAPAPEIYLYRPDEVLVERSEPLGLEDTGASLDTTVTLSGRQLVGVATPKGSGAYLVRVAITAEGGAGAASLGYTADRVHLTTNVRPEATFGAPVFDAFGNPMAGSVVSWDGGTDCGDGTFCPSGATASTRSSANGYGTLDWQPGADPLWRPTPELAAAGKAAAVDRTEVGKRLERARGLERALGYARTSGGAVLSADLVDMETVKMVRREAQRTWRPLPDGEAKDGPLCPEHPESCDGGGAPVFEAARLTLGQDEDLVDVVVRIMDGGSEIEELDGQPILSDVPLTVEVEATISTASGDRTETIAGPVALAVSEKLGASVQSGSATCSVVRHEGGGFTYKVGRQSSLNYLYDDLQGEPCCWQATEYLSAKIVVDAEVLDDQGDPQRVTKEASSVVRSLPRPLEPCDVHSEFDDDTEVIGNPITFAGTLYTTDLCGNLVLGVGRNDSPFHNQPDDELYVSYAGPPTDPLVTAQVNSVNPDYSMFGVQLRSVDPVHPDETDGNIAPGSYSVHVEVASSSPECSSGGVISGDVPFEVLDQMPFVYPEWPSLAANITGGFPEVVTPGSTVRDTESAQVVMWRALASFVDLRIPAGDPVTYEHVPVKAYLVEARHLLDWDGNYQVDEVFTPVADVELCTGTVYRWANAAGNVEFDSDAKMECDTTWGAVADFEAASEVDGTGEPDSWVAVGEGVGILKAPSQPGSYRLVLEPLDETFRRGDNWQLWDPQVVVDEFSDEEIVVGGGMFLDEALEPIFDDASVPGQRTVFLEVTLPVVQAQVTIDMVYESRDSTQSHTPVVMELVGTSSDDSGVYFAELDLRLNDDQAEKHQASGAANLGVATTVAVGSLGYLNPYYIDALIAQLRLNTQMEQMLFLDVNKDNPFVPLQSTPLATLQDIKQYLPCSDLDTRIGVLPSTLPQSMNLVAAFVVPDGDNVIIVPPPSGAQQAQFELDEVSQFEGIAMNFGTGTDLDFSFGGANPTSQSVAFDPTTRLATVELLCEDYGGYATATVTAGGLAGNLRVPEKAADNRLPKNGWKTSTGTEIQNPGLSEEADEDNTPSTTGPPPDGLEGDGLSNYEEYRGFVVREEHRRTNPFKKDLFVSSNAHTGVAYLDNLPVTVHRVWGQDNPSYTTEYGADREVNHRHDNIGFGGGVIGWTVQRAARGREVAVAPPTFPCNGSCLGQTLPDLGDPNNCTVFEVYLNAHNDLANPPDNYTQAQIDIEYQRSFGHEGGHDVHLCHRPSSACPDGANVGTGDSIMSSALATPPGATGVWVQYNADDEAQIRIHTNP